MRRPSGCSGCDTSDLVSEKATAPELLEASIDIEASPEAVWAVISDPRAMVRLSPQVIQVVVLGGEVRVGTECLSVNKRGLLVWPMRSQVTTFEPAREYAFRMKDNWARWSYTLTPTETGTHVVERRELPEGLAKVSGALIDVALGGQESFSQELREGMAATLAALKAECESA